MEKNENLMRNNSRGSGQGCALLISFQNLSYFSFYLSCVLW